MFKRGKFSFVVFYHDVDVLTTLMVMYARMCADGLVWRASQMGDNLLSSG